MKFLKVSLSLAIAMLSLTSCTVGENGNLIFEEFATSANSGRKSVDPSSKYYSKGHYVYIDEANLDSLNPGNSRIEIDLSEQRTRVFEMGGEKDRLVIETQVSTGNSTHPTPTGKYRILEKSPKKRSNLYGKWIDGSGNVITSDGDSREPPKVRNAKFQGANMPYWLRLTGSGVGLHIGYVPDGPASHGCIRVPAKVQPLIYKKVKIGTPVAVTP